MVSGGWLSAEILAFNVPLMCPDAIERRRRDVKRQANSALHREDLLIDRHMPR
jgi:hypothetical protein